MTSKVVAIDQALPSVAERPWWEDAVVYQIYPRSFQDSNGDGVGDLTGMRRRMGYLRWLGVDALWLSPLYRSPMLDFGYDVADHTAVDPVFGTLSDLDALIADAHRLGLRVLLDFVPNHTSDRHQWFEESRSSWASAKRDWYVWRDPAPGGGPPNNWVSVFGGPAWTLDQATGQYYLHSFLEGQPDLNWRNAEVERAMFDVLRFWIDRGVDGFRVDAAEHVLKDPLLRDNPLAPDAHTAQREYDTQLHIHDRGQADAHALYRRLRRLLDNAGGSPRLALAEILAHPKPDQLAYWASFYGEELDEIHLPLNLALTNLPWSAEAFATTINAVEAVIPDGGWPTIVFGSHDEPRVASRYGPEAARLLLCLLFTLRGTPILYNGDELGLTNSPVPAGQARDPRGQRQPERNRDLGRTPMAWEGRAHAGFTNAASTPWLPLPEGAEAMSVDAQRSDPLSTLALARRLIALRQQHPALRRGAYHATPIEAADCLAYERRDDKQGLLVVANFAAALNRVGIPTHRGVLVFSTEGGATLDDNELRLGPREAAIVAIHDTR
jgi:alpha-glucosidase